MAESDINPPMIEMTAEIVSSYVTKNALPMHELGNLIADVHAALTRTVAGPPEPEPEPLKPAVPIRKSVTGDKIICLEDGKAFKSLKRHLLAHHEMTPAQYRERWGLPVDYPMVAPNYSAARSELAQRIGLGQQRRRSAAPAKAEAESKPARSKTRDAPAKPKAPRKPKAAKATKSKVTGSTKAAKREAAK